MALFKGSNDRQRSSSGAVTGALGLAVQSLSPSRILLRVGINTSLFELREYGRMEV
jgi:hypothetical protein